MHDQALAADIAARAAALDVARSFIVQAPAGSGKTELLIQRYLALLAGVEQPETIVAMTFTRKAAGEVRDRIIEALRTAAQPMPDEAHKALTWQLAQAALARDATLNWGLIAHPARLRVQTIDALCASLMRQAPLTTKLGAVPRFIERADALYARAARDELAAADASDPAWRRLLEHLDNDADRVVSRLANMLGKRDQWLRHLVTDDTDALRAALERALRAETENELAALAARFPPSCIKRLLELERFAAQNLEVDGGPCGLAACAAAGGLPPPTADALGLWRALADWLLTKKGEFRRQVDVKQGFPLKGKATDPGAAERAAGKQAMEALLSELSAVPGVAAALALVRRLPPPRYDEAAWSFVAALLEVLPRAAARLQLVFAQEASIDFAEATLVALRALAAAEAPSDLLLAIDLRVEHLLVDEFQDTSLAQCELIEQLIAGWQQGDGRTLFVVGDPMQSIYRFREAEVGLFVAAQQRQRIGEIGVEPLTLSRNFRARKGLVEWVNGVFPRVLPARDDAARGAVAFRSAIPTRGSASAAEVTVDLCADARTEAAIVVDHIRAALAAGHKTIAVLVRKRPDLVQLLPILRSEGIAFSAIDIDHLAQRQAVLDLVSLTHALIQPHDRTAWLSALRAPWCGLTLPDLFAVAADAASFPEVMTDGKVRAALSADGAARLARFAAAVAPALAQRGRVPLATMVRGTWLALGGPACTTDEIDLAAADAFFGLLAAHAVGIDVPNWQAFIDALARLCAEPEAALTTNVRIMTLHRAKGLEFDVVVMPALARAPKSRDQELLLWRQRPAGLLLAPLKGRVPGRGEDPVYSYLRTLAADEDAAELGRLLYVGCTRARERLHLTAVADVDHDLTGRRRWRKPARGTSLHALWHVVADNASVPVPPAPGRLPLEVQSGVLLLRLPRAWRALPPPPSVPGGAETAALREREPIAFDWAREAARQIGVIAHRLFKQLAGEDLASWSERRLAAWRPVLERELGALGFSLAEAQLAAAQVVASVTTTLEDARGRWLFDPRHGDAKSEYALTGWHDDAPVHVVLDRTFIDPDGVRWIVDFKLSRHEGAGAELFLDNERERYAAQLECYARVMRGIDSRPIRLGLYFPLMAGWREWPAGL